MKLLSNRYVQGIGLGVVIGFIIYGASNEFGFGNAILSGVVIGLVIAASSKKNGMNDCLWCNREFKKGFMGDNYCSQKCRKEAKLAKP